MTPALTPPLALGYLRELSADVREAVVLDGDRALLAGPPQLAGPARALLAAAGEAPEVDAEAAGGVVLAARSDRHAVVLVCGPLVLRRLARHDLRTVLADLGGRVAPPVAGVPARDTLRPLAEALISAVQRGSAR